MNLEQMQEIVNLCEFALDGIPYTFTVTEKNGVPYLQASYQERDIVTGEDKLQKTRKWQLSEHMVEQEIVGTVFLCIQTSVEHRTREHFLYKPSPELKGRRIFQPHFSPKVLWEAAGHKSSLDYRGKD
jgi:hypothetical protein